jgi:hypothetical protein
LEENVSFIFRAEEYSNQEISIKQVAIGDAFLLGLFQILKMEAKYSSETSVDTRHITRRYISKDTILVD